MKPHLVRIHEFARPVDGMLTHLVRTPGLRHGAMVCSLADARRIAAGFIPTDGRPVEIREKLRTSP